MLPIRAGWHHWNSTVRRQRARRLLNEEAGERTADAWSKAILEVDNAI
jgi:hypothetical protein